MEESAGGGPIENGWLLGNIAKKMIKGLTMAERESSPSSSSGITLSRAVNLLLLGLNLSNTNATDHHGDIEGRNGRLLLQLMVDHDILVPATTTTSSSSSSASSILNEPETSLFKLHPSILEQLKNTDNQNDSSKAIDSLDLQFSFDLDRAPQPGEIRTEEQYLKYLLCFRLAWNYERQRLLTQLMIQKEEFENSAALGGASSQPDSAPKDDQPKKPKKIRKVLFLCFFFFLFFFSFSASFVPPEHFFLCYSSKTDLGKLDRTRVQDYPVKERTGKTGSHL
jgi:hypothetical protein